MKKGLFGIYSLFLIIFCIILGMTMVNGSGTTSHDMFPDSTGVNIMPEEEYFDADNSYNAKFSADIIKDAGGCLSFPTTYMDVSVYADGETVYENIGPHSRFIKSHGDVWHFIAVSDSNKEIDVKIVPVYEESPVTSVVFTAGDYYNIRSSVVVDSTFPLIISILDILFGLVLIINFSYRKLKVMADSKMIFFGVTAVLIGLWAAGETNALVVLINNRHFTGILAFLILIFIPAPYIIYIHESLWATDKFLYRIPICVSLFNFVLVMGLAVLDIMDLKQSVGYTHMSWAVSIIYVIASIVNAFNTHRIHKNRMVLINAVAMLVLIGVAAADIYLFWSGGGIQDDVVGRILVLLYFGNLAYLNTVESMKEFEKARMADYYKELANTDSITKLNNRTAFNHDVEKLEHCNEYCIISMDLNDLKKINDTKGHQAGDRYIINASNIIREVFEKDGKCYRIGGDEFSVIIRKDNCEYLVKELILQLEQKLKVHNKKYPSDPVIIAWGYEIKAAGEDRDYRQILYLADEKMYKDKGLKKKL